MMRVLSLLIFICVSQLSYTQDNKVIIKIDSLHLNNIDTSLFFIKQSMTPPFPLDQRFVKNCEIITFNKIKNDIYRVLAKAEIHYDSSEIRLSIDDNDGYITFTSFDQKFPDTLKFKNWNLRKSYIQDTTIREVRYYKILSKDSISNYPSYIDIKYSIESNVLDESNYKRELYGFVLNDTEITIPLDMKHFYSEEYYNFNGVDSNLNTVQFTSPVSLNKFSTSCDSFNNKSIYKFYGTIDKTNWIYHSEYNIE